MKKKINLIIFMLFAFILQGQEYSYVPYVTEGSIWSYAYRLRIGSGQDDYKTTFSKYRMVEDTICIDSNCYNKLFSGCGEGSYYGALREQDKKVYFIENGNSSEELIYDFSLGMGDVFVINVDDTVLYTMTVSNIDSVQIGDNLRRRFYFDGGFSEFWIEGIGSVNFFREPYAITLEDATHNINYKKENGEIIYRSTESWFNENDCEGIGTENVIPYDGTNALFQNAPNPFNVSTTIKYQLSDNVTNAKICIYNLTGKQLQCYNLPASKGESLIEVRASSLQAGMYLYSLIVGDKLISSKCMVLTE